jgi:UDP-N-acetyl-D-glucosamine dehydrogenase
VKNQKILESLIRENKAKIGVVGLGYVGLPLALEFAKKNFSVTGFDVDEQRVSAVNRGSSPVQDISSDVLKNEIKNGTIRAFDTFDRLGDMDAIIICVPTPLRKTKDPDISYIVAAVDKVQKTLKRGQLIILESTTYPGTTRELLLPALEKKGLKAGSDFFLAFSPERIDPGNVRFGIKNTPKIIGGITPVCSHLAGLLYSRIVDRVVPVSSTEAAEMVKLLENTFRAVNIGLVNEIALMCDRLKLDTWEVIDAAATKPFGYMPFYPGPGLGGHCIPLDPHYLSWKLKSLNFYSRFIELASQINSGMPEYLVSKISDALNQHGKCINKSKILLIGVAYKRDIGDVRESPALDVIHELSKREASIAYHDPYVPHLKIDGISMKSIPLNQKTISMQDCVVIVTDHKSLDFEFIVKNSSLVVDSRNATKNIKSKNITKL